MPVLLWLAGPIGRYVVLALAIAGAFLYFRQHYIDIGYNKATTKVEAQNKRAKKEADDAAKSVDDCFNRGGWWDISRGLCSLKPGQP